MSPSTRIYIFSGWLGRPLSAGMASLIPRLKPYGSVQFLPWKAADQVPITNSVPLVIIGYSQGGVNLAWLDRKALGHRNIQLGIAYDPRGGDYGLSRGGIFEVGKYDRLVCFHNAISTWYSIPYGYAGKGVETAEINEWHPLVQWDKMLHDRTVAEVRKLAEG